jgi:hypothetical protein
VAGASTATTTATRGYALLKLLKLEVDVPHMFSPPSFSRLGRSALAH